MLTIAISGGIGSGKSTLTNYLINKGYIVIDADKMAREMTSAGGKAMPYVKEHFGDKYILPDGSMDRAEMRDLVFRNPEAKLLLEQGTTKVVLEDIEKIKTTSLKNGVTAIFFDIPQLFEHNLESDYDQVWTVVADYEIKKDRIKKRDSIPDNIIDLIIGSQIEDEDRINKSTEVIYNNSSIIDLYSSIDKLLKKYDL